jgi:hypothetical protein
MPRGKTKRAGLSPFGLGGQRSESKGQGTTHRVHDAGGNKLFRSGGKRGERGVIPALLAGFRDGQNTHLQGHEERERLTGKGIIDYVRNDRTVLPMVNEVVLFLHGPDFDAKSSGIRANRPFSHTVQMRPGQNSWNRLIL